MIEFYWVALTDPKRPKGQQAIGAIVVPAASEEQAADDVDEIIRDTEVIRWPEQGVYTRVELAACERHVGVIENTNGPPAEYVHRVLSRREAEELARIWAPGGEGRLATPEEIKAAFLDDDAERGEPLFPPGTPPFHPPAADPPHPPVLKEFRREVLGEFVPRPGPFKNTFRGEFTPPSVDDITIEEIGPGKSRITMPDPRPTQEELDRMRQGVRGVIQDEIDKALKDRGKR